MSKPVVAIGMPAYGPQNLDVMLNVNQITHQMQDVATFGGLLTERVSNVDINRNKIVDLFLRKTNADYLWWIDADNTPPVDALGRLLGVRKELVSGLYYGGKVALSKNADIRPVAYLRRPDGAYHTLDQVYQWERGEIIPVDGVGMGCFLTHRSVYEKIEDEFAIVQAMNGWQFTVKKTDIKQPLADEPTKHPYAYEIRKDTFHLPVRKPSLTSSIFPHFQCQFTRTEDFVFCENAKAVGFDIFVDTSVEVGHVKSLSVDGAVYRENKNLVADGRPKEVTHV